jgi:hypothetical protein
LDGTATGEHGAVEIDAEDPPPDIVGEFADPCM